MKIFFEISGFMLKYSHHLRFFIRSLEVTNSNGESYASKPDADNLDTEQNLIL